MKVNKKNSLRFIFFTVFHFWFVSCGKSPDLGDSPGVCTLSCGSSYIAGKESSIRILNFASDPGDMTQAEIPLSCINAADGSLYPEPVAIKFVIESPALPDSTAGQLPSGSTTPQATPTPVKNPQGGISFNIAVTAGYVSTKPNIDTGGKSDIRARYRGISTAQSEWCTDSCGVGIFEVTPLCKKGNNDVYMLLSSGSLSKVIHLSVQNVITN